MKHPVYILLALVLTGCGSVSYVGIETFNPSEITFPEKVKTVLIVNNALPQPPDVGYECKEYGVEQDTCRAYADSALFDATRALGESILENGFFEDVLLYHYGTRTDEVFYSDQKLTPDQINALCYENGADAIISIDRLLFHMKKNVAAFSAGYVMGVIEVDIRSVVRSYLPGRENPLATVLVHDSIFWAEDAPTDIVLKEYLPAPTEALREAGKYIGRKIYPNFVPYWKNDTRWYYNGQSTAWKEASAFAKNSRWDQAYERWKRIYDRASGWSDKARSASNIALFYEVNNDLEKALEWATVSHGLFKENKGEGYKYTTLQQVYLNVLHERTRSDKKLDIQIR